MSGPVKPLRLEMRLRNNRIWRSIRESGFDSVAAFARATGLSGSEVGRYLNLRERPVRIAYEHIRECAAEGCESRVAGPKSATCRAHLDLRSVEEWIESGLVPIVWKGSAQRLAKALGESCDHLWPEETRMLVASVTRSVELDLEEAQALAAGPQDSAAAAELAGRLQLALSMLGDRERAIVERWFGIGCESETLGEIAGAVGISRGRVQQIKDAALRKLRHPSLAGFLL